MFVRNRISTFFCFCPAAREDVQFKFIAGGRSPCAVLRRKNETGTAPQRDRDEDIEIHEFV